MASSPVHAKQHPPVLIVVMVRRDGERDRCVKQRHHPAYTN
jgi:hypothetical protein